MIPSVVRMGILLLVPAACAAGHYLLATGSADQATHFIAPSTQSAVLNPAVADKASVSLETFERLVVGEQVIVIDARHPSEFIEGHIPGAKNLHVEAVESDVTILTTQIDPLADVVLYCATAACEDSGRLFDIMTQLLEYPNVRLFRGGMAAWRAAGLPIEEGPSR